MDNCLDPERKYSGLDVRQAMQDKALEIVVCLDKDEPKEEVGATKLLSKLEEYVKKENTMHKMSKVKDYYKIERDHGVICTVI